MKKVLMVIAHADDEVICGWPIFQDDGYEKEVVLCSSDLFNPQRQWCAHRKYVLQDICDDMDIPLKVYDLPSGFYKAESRQGTLARIQNEIMADIANTDCDAVFTHNPLGEYGHLDHKMCFEMALRATTKPLLYTDILLKSNWQEHEEIPPGVRKVFYPNNYIYSGPHELNEELYKEVEDKYREAGVWTWNKPPVKKCLMYRFTP